MKLNFVKVNPVGNMTIFVMDHVYSSHHMLVANRLMDYSNIHGEQVGFIENPRTLKGKALNTLRLQMMGGEFCGNATRSLAALMVHLKSNSVSEKDNIFNVSLEVSGSKELIHCQVRALNKENSYYSKVDMPLPERVSDTIWSIGKKMVKMIRVDFPGITHFIVEADEVEDKEDFFNEIKKGMLKEKCNAFGIMFYDSHTCFLNPLVYVKATDSKCWEKSCASGTSALGIALSKNRNSSISEKIKQPGGELEVEVVLNEGNIFKLSLDGKVEIIAEGIVYINDQL